MSHTLGDIGIDQLAMLRSATVGWTERTRTHTHTHTHTHRHTHPHTHTHTPGLCHTFAELKGLTCACSFEQAFFPQYCSTKTKENTLQHIPRQCVNKGMCWTVCAWKWACVTKNVTKAWRFQSSTFESHAPLLPPKTIAHPQVDAHFEKQYVVQQR